MPMLDAELSPLAQKRLEIIQQANHKLKTQNIKLFWSPVGNTDERFCCLLWTDRETLSAVQAAIHWYRERDLYCAKYVKKLRSYTFYGVMQNFLEGENLEPVIETHDLQECMDAVRIYHRIRNAQYAV